MGGVELFSTNNYSGWTSHFWPPLFSFLIGTIGQLTSVFLAGKLISAISSVLTLAIIWFIIFHFTKNQFAAYIGQLFIAVNPIFVLSSIQIENHMLDTLFFTSSIYFFIRSTEQQSVVKNIIFLAFSTALATLTRYTSYALIPLIIIGLLFYADKNHKLKNSFIFTIIFLLINAPWYYYNYTHNGSILYTWQYMNIGSHVVNNVSQNEWWWSAQNQYSSLSQIVFTHPVNYTLNFIHNATLGIWLTIKNILFIVIIFLYIQFIQKKKFYYYNFKYIITNKFFKLLFIGYFGYLTLVSQAFVFPEVFLSWSIILISFLTISIYKFIVNNRTKKLLSIIIITIIINIGYTGNKINKYINNIDDHGQLADVQKITDILKQDKNITNATIMSIHPARAYYLNAHFLSAPLFFNGTIEQLVKYEGLSQKVIAYAPKDPFIKYSSHPQATYLIYDKALEKNLPQYSFLFNPNTSEIPTTFHLIYIAKNVVVYQIY